MLCWEFILDFISFMGELPEQKENSSAVISSSLKILMCEQGDNIIPAIFPWIDLFRETKNCINPAWFNNKQNMFYHLDLCYLTFVYSKHNKIELLHRVDQIYAFEPVERH